MRILSIDTTSPAGSLALSENDQLIAQEQQGVQGTHVERLLPSIEHLLNVAKWTPQEIEGLAVAIGPGSFTGLRVGLATAKGIALSLNAPLVGVSSLTSLALNGGGFSGTVIPLIDAKRGELYAAAWKVEASDEMHALWEEFVAPPNDVVRRLGELPGELLLVGDGAPLVSERVDSSLKERTCLARGTQAGPLALNLARLALERLLRGEGDNLSQIAPNYIRRSDAEIGFMARHPKKPKATKGGRG